MNESNFMIIVGICLMLIFASLTFYPAIMDRFFPSPKRRGKIKKRKSKATIIKSISNGFGYGLRSVLYLPFAICPKP